MATSAVVYALLALALMVTFASSADNGNAQTTTVLPRSSSTTGNSHTATPLPKGGSSMVAETSKIAGDTTNATVSDPTSKSVDSAVTTEKKPEATEKKIEEADVVKTGLNTETAKSSSARAEPLTLPLEFTMKGLAILIGAVVIGMIGAVLQ